MAQASARSYRFQIRLRAVIALSALVIPGCAAGTTTTEQRRAATQPTVLPHGRPHAVEPSAGVAPGAGGPPQASAGVSIPGADPVPNGPASITRAPAKGAPSDAQVRAAIAQFHAAIHRYHLDRLNFSGVLLGASSIPPGPYHLNIASVYTDYGLPIACGGILHVPELGVANKTLPCGTKVTFIYGHRAIRVPVIDRGPYIPGRMWDLTGATAEALHFPGLGPIAWVIG